MELAIIENGERTGTVTAEGDFDYEYGGETEAVIDALEVADDLTSFDTGVGRAGEVTEERVEAKPEEKAEWLLSELFDTAGVQTVRGEYVGDLEPDEVEKAASLLDRLRDLVGE